MIRALFQAVTGRPWTTTVSMAAQFGPPPAVRHARELSGYTDAELIAYHDLIRTRLAYEQVEQTTTPAGSR